MDLKQIDTVIPAGSVDCVVVNPPYKARNSGIMNEEDTLTIARHEISCTLEDIIVKSSKILKSGGNLYMIHRPERLVDIFYEMRRYQVEPKRIKMVYPAPHTVANLVLIEGVRSGRPFLKWEKPLYVYDSSGKYTDDIFQIYGKERGEK